MVTHWTLWGFLLERMNLHRNMRYAVVRKCILYVYEQANSAVCSQFTVVQSVVVCFIKRRRSNEHGNTTCSGRVSRVGRASVFMHMRWMNEWSIKPRSTLLLSTLNCDVIIHSLTTYGRLFVCGILELTNFVKWNFSMFLICTRFHTHVGYGGF